jgi:hypothetical protein
MMIDLGMIAGGILFVLLVFALAIWLVWAVL